MAQNSLKRLEIVLSFDHELSLGGASCYDTNIFDPTKRIIEVADRAGVPVCLFTDILCAKRFYEWDRDGFFSKYRQQIHAALKSGHEIQLHIHPHWVNSEFVDGKFVPSTSFSLAHFKNSTPPNDIAGIVASAARFLNEMCREVDEKYSCCAYRAGGYNLSGAESEILMALYGNGIRIDSSIAKGFLFKSDISTVDYRIMPKRANWIIPLGGPLSAEADEGMLEIPIVAMPRTPWNNLPFLAKRLIYKKRAYASKGYGIHVGNESVAKKLSRLFPRSVWMAGFDNHTHSVSTTMKILKRYLAAHRSTEVISCSLISHPKSMGNHALELMKNFIDRVRDEYGDIVKFTTYEAIAKRRGLIGEKALTDKMTMNEQKGIGEADATNR
jgi:hypothetical protein